ncbi:MAG: 16S rRNA (cytidine(1402)-2'-O)-methyltransferase [Gammaproteobacteria bacterium]|nr:16S rRNA (cytidine(1402)-2'-O)-methyltransferase [Gammaproteobacteria bacterium]NND35700.1 16S rRNA (cytidine(1402)-2'-O)-methyltransferase [Gammaproteobacteria bacterium]
MSTHPGTLFVIATPIGNLDDISARARETLDRVDLVAAEDTRRAGQLLTRLGIHKHLVSLHEHNEAERVEELVEDLLSGRDVALISDAGTPLVSDPGYRLLAELRRRDLPVSPVPGPCAAIATLSIAGLPTDRFTFEGFLPAKGGARRRRLADLEHRTETLILYESVHRIGEVLEDIEQVLGSDRQITVARELTKLHETIYRGPVEDVRRMVEEDPGGGKGEFTIVIGGDPEPPDADNADLERILEILLAEVSAKQAASLAAEITGASRKHAYRLANELRDRLDPEQSDAGAADPEA